MDVAINRRIRHFGLAGEGDETPEMQAVNPLRGYVLGLLLLGNRISQVQHEAGILYGEDMSRYYKLKGVPFPSARAQDLFAVRGEAGESVPQIRAARAATKRMLALRAALLAAGGVPVTGRRIEHTVRAVCLLDLPDSYYVGPSFMSGLLVRGLNALVQHYGLMRNT